MFQLTGENLIFMFHTFRCEAPGLIIIVYERMFWNVVDGDWRTCWG